MRFPRRLVALEWVLFWGVAGNAQAEKVLRVLTYSSFLGPDSWGETVKKEFQKQYPSIRVEYVNAGELVGLLGYLRKEHRTSKSTTPLDVVVGLESLHYRVALNEKLVHAGKVFSQSPLVFLADTTQYPPAQWPKSWREVPKKLGGKVFLEDPRLSGVGAEWLPLIFEKKRITLKESRQIVGAVFPSWSSAYQAFLEGKSPVIWTFLTSEAYHRCRDRQERYRAIPLKEGYPLYEEWAAFADKNPSSEARYFMELLLQEKMQRQMTEKNWMLPGQSSVALPTCYRELTQVTAWPFTRDLTSSTLRDWLDQWSW